MSADLATLTSLATEADAEIVISRLRVAGIVAIHQRKLGGPEGSLGGHDVCVSVKDLERAGSVLAADEGTFSDEELTRLSEQAYREATEE